MPVQELKVLPQYLMVSMEAGSQPEDSGRILQFADPTLVVGKLVRALGPGPTIVPNESAGATVLNVERFDRPTGTPCLIYGDQLGNIKVVLSLEDTGCDGSFAKYDQDEWFPGDYATSNDDLCDLPGPTGNSGSIF